MRCRTLVLFMMLGVAFFSSGCLHLSRTAPFQYGPTPIRYQKSIPRSIGFNVLIDDRPRGDRVRTRSIENIPKKITAKLAEDLGNLRIFKAVHFPPTPIDDVIITGTIKRFSWRAYENPLGYVPLVNLIEITGMPLGVASGAVDIRLEVKDGKTGMSLGMVSGFSHAHSILTLYCDEGREPGSELGESFRVAETQLNEKIVSKLQQN